MKRIKEAGEWDKYWKKDNSNPLANIYRKLFLSRPMSKLIDTYFLSRGKFLEAGSATDTHYYNKKKRYMVAMDISKEAL